MHPECVLMYWLRLQTFIIKRSRIQPGEAVSEIRKSSRPHAPKRISDDFEATMPIMNRRNRWRIILESGRRHNLTSFPQSRAVIVSMYAVILVRRLIMIAQQWDSYRACIKRHSSSDCNLFLWGKGNIRILLDIRSKVGKSLRHKFWDALPVQWQMLSFLYNTSHFIVSC